MPGFGVCQRRFATSGFALNWLPLLQLSSLKRSQPGSSLTQSDGQVTKVSSSSQMLSPQTLGGHSPQSALHVRHDSPTSQIPSPQGATLSSVDKAVVNGLNRKRIAPAPLDLNRQSGPFLPEQP